MLIEILIAWVVVVPALVVSGLYVAAGYLSRREAGRVRVDAWFGEELFAEWRQSAAESPVVPVEA